MRPWLWLQVRVSRAPPPCAEAVFSQQNEDAEDAVLGRRKLSLKKICVRLEEDQRLGVLSMSVYSAEFPSVGFRAGYSKTRYLDVWNILSWGSWRKQQKQDDHSNFVPTLFPKTDHKFLMWEVSSLYLEERSIFTFEYKGCQEESEWKGLVSVPSLLYLPIILNLSYCFMTFHPSSKLASNTQVELFLGVFISSRRLTNHINFNK